jgi:hypothetical protein
MIESDGKINREKCEDENLEEYPALVLRVFCFTPFYLNALRQLTILNLLKPTGYFTHHHV